ncbi:hypothetical protein MARPU_07420 [Marichromatium purpuratum 984]|uniref:DUF1134 domain-containing protein n=2 Tax=Marichromatium purpuratum TaxID=37487 RepID=W0DYP2_MARPU|nr:hypothetical protein MARPU_07420 [Marichromatium purpuratum 984]
MIIMSALSPRLVLCLLLALAPALAPAVEQTYRQQEILDSLETFFGDGAENLGTVVRKVFREQGEPNGYITGEEVGAALGVGVRYGKGRLYMKDGYTRPVYWQGPSIGFDIGANAAKVFVLVYRLATPDALFQRYPGAEGSLYFVGGVGVNYLQSGDTVLAPIRFGAGWRQGVSAGYMDFTRKAHLNPF